CLERSKGSNRVGKRLPRGDRIGKRSYLFFRRRELQPFSEIAHDGFKNFPIITIFPRLRRRFEAGVKLEQFRIRNVLPVRGEDWFQGRKYPRLPVNQSSVAVERQCLKTREIHHAPLQQ